MSRNCPAGIYSSDRIRKIISYIFKGFSGDGVASSSFLPLFFYVDTRSFQPQKKNEMTFYRRGTRERVCVSRLKKRGTKRTEKKNETK